MNSEEEYQKVMAEEQAAIAVLTEVRSKLKAAAEKLKTDKDAPYELRRQASETLRRLGYLWR